MSFFITKDIIKGVVIFNSSAARSNAMFLLTVLFLMSLRLLSFYFDCFVVAFLIAHLAVPPNASCHLLYLLLLRQELFFLFILPLTWFY